MKNIQKRKTLVEAVVVFAVAMAFIMPVSAMTPKTQVVAQKLQEPKILRSSEWIAQNSGFETASRGIRYLDAVNQNVAWAIAYDGSGSNAPQTDFTRTINGGDLWVAGAVLGESDYSLGNICGLSETIGYVALFNQVGAQDSTCGVYKTSDGGSHWTHLTAYPASFANNVYFWNENEGVALGDTLGGYFDDYFTHDGGVTWARVPQANYTGVPAQSGEGGWTGVMDAVGENTIIFGTNMGNVYISNDRGDHWVASYSGIGSGGTNPGVNEIAFKDPTHGIVAHDNGGTFDLFGTSDGGVTWTPITPSGPVFTAGLAYVPGTDNMYVTTGATTGASGASYSLDGGQTWTEYTAMTDIQMLATDFTDGMIGWAGGFNTDAATGGMFKYVPSGNPEPAFSIDVTGGKGLSVKISNIGEADATNVAVTITITGGLFVSPKSFTGSQGTLVAGGNFTVTGAPKGIGLGIIKPIPSIKIDVTCTEGITATKTVTAKIFFSKVTLQ